MAEDGRSAGEDSAVKAMGEARAAMLGLTLLTLCTGALVTGRDSSAGAALGFTALLCSSSVFIAKSLEFRPDVPAMLLLVVALGLRASAHNRLTGLACGLALLFTPKSLFPMAGLMASFLWAREGEGREWRRSLGRFAQGLSAPLLAMALWLFWGNALYPAIRFAVVEAARWVGPSAGPLVVEFIRTDMPLVALFVMGAVATVSQWPETSLLQRAAFSMTVTGFAGVFLVTYPSRQFLLLSVPPCAVLVGLAWDQLLGKRLSSAWQTTAGHLVLSACVAAIGFPEHVRAFARGNTGAVVALQQIARNTAPDEQVMDGFLGYAPFRSHGTFFPFLHRDLRLLRERTESPSLLARLQSGRLLPKFALMNHYLQEGVAPAVWDFLEANYVPLDEDPEVRVRLFDNGLGYWSDTAPRSLVPTSRPEPHVLTLGGWSAPHEIEGRSGRWLSSDEPSVLLVPVRESGPFDLSIDLTTSGPVTLRVEIDGVALPLADFAAGSRTHHFETSGHVFRSGLNRIVLTGRALGRRRCFVSSLQLIDPGRAHRGAQTPPGR